VLRPLLSVLRPLLCVLRLLLCMLKPLLSVLRPLLCVAFLLAQSALVGAVVTVDNPNQPADGHRTLRFESGRTLDTDGASCLVGYPVSFATAGDYLLLLDRQLCAVHAFDSWGDCVASFGQPGEGPGDFRVPWKLLALDDSTVCILDHRPATIHMYSIGGLHFRSEAIPGCGHQVVVDDLAGSTRFLVALRADVDPIREAGKAGSRTTSNLLRVQVGAPPGPVYHAATCDFFYSNDVPVCHEIEQYQISGFACNDTSVYVAGKRNDYCMTQLSMNGDVIREITREYRSRRRTTSERDSIHTVRSVSVGGCLVMEYREAATDPDIMDMRIAADGKLWVLPSRGALDPPPGIYQVWDVFDRNGIFCEQVQVVLDCDQAVDQVFWLSTDDVVLCRNWKSVERAIHTGPGIDEGRREEDLLDQPLEVVPMFGTWTE